MSYNEIDGKLQLIEFLSKELQELILLHRFTAYHKERINERIGLLIDRLTAIRDMIGRMEAYPQTRRKSYI